MTKSDEELIAAARAVVERWDTPHWKDVPATAVFINRLRDALAGRLEGRGGGEVVAEGGGGALGLDRDAAVIRQDATAALIVALRNNLHAILQALRDGEKAQDKIEGLTADLFEAVSVAYNRGAVEWTFLNYRSWIDRIEANSRADAARSALTGEGHG